MGSPSPYDLSAEAERRKITQEDKLRDKKAKRIDHSSSSPYDLSSHGGLAALAMKARKNPLLFR